MFEQASIDRVIAMAGANVRTARTVVLRGDNPRDLELSPNPDSETINGGRILTMSANAVTHVSVENVANSIEEFAPQLLCAYPTALETICRYLRDNDRRLAIPAVVTSSEVFRPEARRLCEYRLGARVIDYYGQAERIAFAYASEPREYRFSCAYSYVEFEAYDGQVLPPNSPHQLYEVIGTSYWNSVLPMVRYRTGDLVRVPVDWESTSSKNCHWACGPSRRAGAPAGSHRLPADRASQWPGIRAARHRQRDSNAGGRRI